MKTKIDAGVAMALAIASTLALAGAADPQAAALLHKLTRLYPATAFTSLTRTPIEGVYEVVMGQNVAYVGSDGRHFLFGHLFDMRTQTDLTAHKLTETAHALSQAQHVRFASLPLADAIKAVKGDGSRIVAVFSDPTCPYCKALEKALDELDNVTIYTFLLSWLGPESRPAAEAAWVKAAPERAKDTAVLDRNQKLASEIGLRGTPMLIAADGRVIEGAKPAEELDAWLTPGNRPVSLRTPAKQELKP